MALTSLRSRIFLGIGMVAVVCTGSMVVGVMPVMREFIERSIVDRLETARTSFGRYLDSRFRLLESTVSSVASEPRVIATLGIEDIDQLTAAGVATQSRAVLEVDLVVFTNDRGEILATSSASNVRVALSAQDEVLRAPLRGEQFSGLFHDASGLFLVAAAPVITGEQLLGVIVAGERVDERIVGEFREALGTDVMVLREGKPLVWSTPTSDPFDPHEFARAFGRRGPSTTDSLRVRTADTDRFVIAPRLDDRTRMVLSRSAGEIVELERYVWTWVLGCGLLGLVFATIIGQWIARRLSNPLRDLANAAAQVAAGNLDAAVGESSMFETRRLGRAFNHMTQQVRQLVEDVRSKADVLQQQRNELEWSNRMKTNFLVNASHELRTPITNILSSSEILTTHEADEDQETRREFLRMIESEASRVSLLVDQLLDVAQMEAGSAQLSFEDFDFGSAVDSLVEAFRAGPGKDRAVEYRRSGASGSCVGDRKRLLLVVEQLLDNVVKFTPGGSPVLIDVRECEGEIELRVADRGVGFAGAEERERIFERFVQGGDILTEKPAGVGLGLSIARDIARAHAGELRCDAREGGGSVFVLTIPARVLVSTG